MRPIHRSMLILPVNVPRFVEKAYKRGADAIALDLEDAVPPHKKAEARGFVRSAAEIAGRGGADVYVRVNNDPALLADDVASAVIPGVYAVFLPKTETGSQVSDLEGLLTRLERDRGMHLGTIKLSVHIESPLGILNLRRIAEAGSRIESMSMGVDDYCLQLGVTPSSDATELLFPFMHMVTVCKAYNIHPIGILGSVADFRRLEHFRAAAIKAEKLGATGAYCIHPDQVEILNTVFSPSPADLEWAEGVIAVFEEALQQGRASTSLDGKMVDTPIYKRALNTIERARELQKSDARKTQALAVANDPA